MILTNVYHSLKPLLPRRLQINFRRALFLARRSAYRKVWPIDERAGRLPEGWTGWPGQRRFAFVLTHDVEGPGGVEKCHELADIDRNFNFRSCFNFVPESCNIPDSLRRDLVANGFEVGVHGLCHDGNLFASRKKFVRMAGDINRYLKEWRSIGFRTPSMYHNLDWVAELDIEYDSSTFDTDPYEPQPDGMGTIFPFWVEGGPTTRGFVELPYTLPQDFTLFIIMKEETIDIWKRKLDWVAEKGGMALLITHPDYMKYGKGKCAMEEYPSRLYEEMLDYVGVEYAGQYWHALPMEMARFWKERM